MKRTKPTFGNRDWFLKYLEVFNAKLTQEIDPKLKDRVLDQVRQIHSVIGPIHTLNTLNGYSEFGSAKKLKEDKTAHLEYDESWMRAAFEILVEKFGINGTDTISSIQEAVSYTYAIADLFGSKKIFFRGEHKYGNSLESRAERKMNESEKKGNGITKREIKELRRF